MTAGRGILGMAIGLAAVATLLALASLLTGHEPAQAQSSGPTVTGVDVTSDAGSDDTYLLGETIRVTLTFSESVDVTGTPRLKIDMDPADWGEKWAGYVSGSGTASLTFTHTVVEPNYSTQGIAVLENTLELNGGTIRSASSQTDADLSHTGLAHDSSHKVDWHRSPPAPTPEPTPTQAPSVTGVSVTSNAGDDDTYLLGETIRVTLTFSDSVNVTGSPRLKIDMDPAEWGEKWAEYASGSGTTSLTFTHTVVEPNLSRQGIAVLENTLELNGGSIKSASSQTDADLSHTGLGHDASHKVDWQRSQPNRAPVINEQAQYYDWFTGRGNAPRGMLVWKPFHDIFTDPDGDELTYTASVPDDQSDLVEPLAIRLEREVNGGEIWNILFFEADANDDWKTISPALSDPVTVTVTLTATDPGGLSVSSDGYFVIDWDSHPEVVSAVADEQAIELTFDTAVEDTSAPTPEQFTVNVVNGDGSTSTVSVSSVSVNGAVVTLGLASALTSGQTVTLDYVHDADTPLKRDSDGGDHAPSFSGQAVDMSQLEPPGEPQNFAVSSDAGDLNLSATWDAVEDATSYKLRWRESGGEFDAANAITVNDAIWVITVSGYGRWEVRAQGCNDAGCGPEASSTVEVVKAVSLRLARAVDTEGNVRPRTISASWDAVASSTSYKLRWERTGANPPAREQAQDQSDAAVRQTRAAAQSPALDRQASGDGGQKENTRTANQLTFAAEQTSADITVPDDGAYRVELQALDDDEELIALAHGHVDQAHSQPDTTPPRIEHGVIDGNKVTLYFNEPLDEGSVGGFIRTFMQVSKHTWRLDPTHGGSRPVRDNVEIRGNKVTFDLGSLRARVGLRVQGEYVRHNGSLRDLAGNPVSTPYRRYIVQWSTGWRVFDNVTGLPHVTGVEISSDAGADRLYADGETIRVKVTFSESVDVTGTPRLKIDLDRAYGGDRWASYESASGTTTLVFAYTVAEGDISTEGVAVLWDTLDLNGGRIRSTGTHRNAHLWYAGLEHDPEHKVEWGQPVPTPWVTGVAISSDPVNDDTYAYGETIQVAVTYDQAVNVTGTPRLKIDLDRASGGERWASYASGSGTTTLEFAYTVAEPDRSSEGVAVLRDTLDLNDGAIRSTDTHRNARLRHAGLDLKGGTIRSVATPPDVRLWHAGLDHDADHMVDWRRSSPGPPWVIDVAVSSDPGDDGTYALGDTIQVTATFSKPVNVDTTGGTPRLKIRMAPHLYWFDTDDAERWANYAGGSGTAELTFTYTVLGVNRSTYGVAVLGNTLELNGGTIRSTATPPVNAHLQYEGLRHDQDHRVDGVTPALQGVAVSGTKVSLNFSEALDGASVPPPSAFTVKRTPQGGVEETVGLSGSPTIAGGAVILTLANAVMATDTGVKVSYAKPTAAGANKLKDLASNEAASFTDQAADATDTTPPRLVRGEIDGDVMTIYFSEALDEDSVSVNAGDSFRVNLDYRSNWPQDGQCPVRNRTFTTSPREVYVSGNTVVLVGLNNDERRRVNVLWTLTNLVYRADVTVTKRLRDLSGNPVSTPRHSWGNQWRTRFIFLENVTRLPWPRSATVDGKQLTLIFSAPMDGNSKPVAGAFTVRVNRSAVSLDSANPVSVSSREVTLTLATAVASGDAVTVSYAKPESSPLRNVVCERAPSFTDQTVTNSTP